MSAETVEAPRQRGAFFLALHWGGTRHVRHHDVPSCFCCCWQWCLVVVVTVALAATWGEIFSPCFFFSRQHAPSDRRQVDHDSRSFYPQTEAPSVLELELESQIASSRRNLLSCHPHPPLSPSLHCATTTVTSPPHTRTQKHPNASARTACRVSTSERPASDTRWTAWCPSPTARWPSTPRSA